MRVWRTGIAAGRRRAQNAVNERLAIINAFFLCAWSGHINAGRAKMRERRNSVIRIGRSDGDDVRRVEARRKMRNEIVIRLACAVVDVSRGGDKQYPGTVQAVDGIQKLCRKRTVAKTRIQHANVRALLVA